MGGFVITVLIAIIAGWLGNIVTGSQISGDIWGISVVALVGAWIGAYMPYFNTFGPKVMDIAMIPTFLCAMIAALIFRVVRRVVKQAS